MISVHRTSHILRLRLSQTEWVAGCYRNRWPDGSGIPTQTELANKFKEGMSYSDLVSLLGTPSKLGLLQKLESDLQQRLPEITSLTEKQLTESIQKVEHFIREFETKREELTKVSSGISFKQLYSAISELQEEKKDHCPACKTPLSQATKNPFKFAEEELTKLGHISKLEIERDQLKTQLLDAIIDVYDILDLVTSKYQESAASNTLSK